MDALLGGKAITWTNLQQPQNEILGSLCHALPCLLREAQVALYNLTIELMEDIVKNGRDPLRTT